ENLLAIKEVLSTKHSGLFEELVDDLILKVKSFGCFFASLDVRQDSSVLRKAHEYLRSNLYPGGLTDSSFEELSEEDKNARLQFKEASLAIDEGLDPLIIDTF